jgi:hypothetical protein
MGGMRSLFVVLFTLVPVIACSSNGGGQTETVVKAAKTDSGADSDSEDAGPTEATKTVLDLTHVKDNPDAYEWFDFRPNVKKLILAGAAETEHVAILWYTVADGGVALHYHSKTESVYVIDGTQTDDKGSYPSGSVYFNPPGSGHAIRDSSGFFLLAYASPPDFMKTDLIESYTPVRIDTRADLKSEYTFEDKQKGVTTFAPALEASGGMSALFVSTSASEPYTLQANYVTVIDGACLLDGKKSKAGTLAVAKAVAPETFALAADGGTCLVLSVSF